MDHRDFECLDLWIGTTLQIHSLEDQYRPRKGPNPVFLIHRILMLSGQSACVHILYLGRFTLILIFELVRSLNSTSHIPRTIQYLYMDHRDIWMPRSMSWHSASCSWYRRSVKDDQNLLHLSDNQSLMLSWHSV
jgi:hypothetical protein